MGWVVFLLLRFGGGTHLAKRVLVPPLDAMDVVVEN